MATTHPWFGSIVNMAAKGGRGGVRQKVRRHVRARRVLRRARRGREGEQRALRVLAEHAQLGGKALEALVDLFGDFAREITVAEHNKQVLV